MKRLAEAIEAGSGVVALMDRIKEHEWRLKQVAAELADLRPVLRLAPSVVEQKWDHHSRLNSSRLMDTAAKTTSAQVSRAQSARRWMFWFSGVPR